MSRSSSALAVLPVVILALVELTAAQVATSPPPVYVSFNFVVPAVAHQFGPQLADAEKAVSETLAKRAETRFRWWRFQPCGSNDYPRLQVWLTKVNSEWRIAATFLTDANADPSERWSVVLFKPGDLDVTGMPSRASWPGEIMGGVETFFLPAHGESIAQTLKELAPLGMQFVHVVPPPPPSADQAQAMLPLNWDKYAKLATSDFLILTDWPTHGRVKLLSTGTGSPAKFPASPDFMAVTVQLRTWAFTGNEEPISIHLGSLGELHPVAFYLLKEDTTGAVAVAPEPR